ncbi:MAG: 50S ribosomal protein L29 [Candidatus Cloacimonas sp. 4484_275]|nr:MAG: 50S ribosomal protein L29 [Candidatus Cloacimonas sp. 4484_275]RLC50333.1 MAG: 50S ribosomal protein L29 [Candidatus Cloacimonadota bacterium]
MKMLELRELTNSELQQKLHEMTEELFNLRFQKATNRLENPARIKFVKRDIARIKTLLTERQKEQQK